MLYLFLFAITCLLLHARFIMGYSWEDIFSPKRWKAVLIWLLKKTVRKLDGSEIYLTKNELIQYAYRVSQCGECIQKGQCVNCNCDAEGRFNGRTDTCSLNKWGTFLSDEEMDKFLKDNKLIFNVKTERK
jgi:hypothetical protein